jgi:hypothetical protein
VIDQTSLDYLASQFSFISALSSAHTPVVQAKYLTFGLPGWAEVMIGFAVGTPIQGLKLFLPLPCVRNTI